MDQTLRLTAFVTALLCASLPTLLASGEPPTAGGAGDAYITLSNTPLGTRDSPLVLRTYFPDPGLPAEVTPNHGLGWRARKYSPGKGDVEGFVDPIRGLPAAVGVNFGPDLSLCWDTTECRLLYAWRGGFLDMTNYWGEPESGRRKGFGYVPEIVGELIYLAEGSPPLVILDQVAKDIAPQYLGYRLVDGVPEFSYRLGEVTVRERIVPGDEPLAFAKHYRVEGTDGIAYEESGYKSEMSEPEAGVFTVTVTGRPIAAGGTAPEDDFPTDKPNVDWGESLYTSLGCLACHSLDGTRGHGPSFAGLYGAERPIAGQDEKVTADEHYLIESITKPQAKVVDTFPPGYMPPYPLEEKQIQSLILFIKTLGNE